MENAVSLVNYFKATAKRVQGIISEMSLTEQQKSILDSLPLEFSTEMGLKVASVNGMDERTFKNFLKAGVRNSILRHERHGVYSKIR